MIFDKIWRLKRKIPKNIKTNHFRLDVDGITKIPVDETKEAENYLYARKRLKEKEDLERL